MRDHRKLKVFGLADDLVITVYRETRKFPRHEQYGLVSQMRRGAISIAANIVEGSGRRTEKEFNRFLDIAFGSIRELGYLIDVSTRLGYLPETDTEEMQDLHGQLAAAMAALIRRREGTGSTRRAQGRRSSTTP
jgi:four helix bundle protein